MAVFPSHKELLPYDVVFFDLDNTIYPYEPAHQSALNIALQLFGTKYKLDESAVKDLYKEARSAINKRLHGQASSHSRLLYFKEMLIALNHNTQYSDALQFEKIYWTHFLSEMQVFPEALKLIEGEINQKFSLQVFIVLYFRKSFYLSVVLHLKSIFHQI